MNLRTQMRATSAVTAGACDPQGRNPDRGPRGDLIELGAADARAVARYLRGLDGTARRRRFHGTVEDAGIEAHCARLDPAAFHAVGLWSAGRITGLAELYLDAASRDAELAVSATGSDPVITVRVLEAAVRLARRVGAVRLVWFWYPGESRALRWFEATGATCDPERRAMTLGLAAEDGAADPAITR